MRGHSRLCYDDEARQVCVCWLADVEANARAVVADAGPCRHDSHDEPCGLMHVTVDAVWNLRHALKDPEVRRGVDRWESQAEEANERINALLDDDPVRISGLDR